MKIRTAFGDVPVQPVAGLPRNHFLLAYPDKLYRGVYGCIVCHGTWMGGEPTRCTCPVPEVMSTLVTFEEKAHPVFRADTVKRSIYLELDMTITTLHEIDQMIGGPLVIGGKPIPGTRVTSIELGAKTPSPAHKNYRTLYWENRPLRTLSEEEFLRGYQQRETEDFCGKFAPKHKRP